MNSVPTIGRTSAVLADFRRLIADAVARETELQLESGKRWAAQNRSAENSGARHAEEATRRRAALADEHRLAIVRATQRFQARADRIQKARVDSRRRATQQIDQHDGRIVFGFQKATLDSEKGRVADLAATQDALAAMNAELATCNAMLVGIETRLRSTLGGIGLFRRWQSPLHPWPAPDLVPDENETVANVHAAFGELEKAHSALKRSFLLPVFRWMPTWLFIVLAAAGFAGAVHGLPLIGHAPIEPKLAGIVAAVAVLIYIGAKFLVQSQARSAAEAAARGLSDVRHWLASADAKATTRHRSDTARIEEEFAATQRRIKDDWSRHGEATARARSDACVDVGRKADRAEATNRRLRETGLARLEASQCAAVALLEQQLAQVRESLSGTSRDEAARVERDQADRWTALSSDWKRGIEPAVAFLAETDARAAESAPDWGSGRWKDWTPPAEFSGPPRIGTLSVDLPVFAGTRPSDLRLRVPGAEHYTLPVWLAYPEQGSLVIETDRTGAEAAGPALNNIAFRLLCQFPPGRLKLTVLDPVGLGQTFASLMHLADYAEAQGGTSQRIWTEPGQIEDRLAELTEHLEKIIQMYLRNDFATLADYNAQAGSIAERHHLLVVTGFPVNFTETAARRLVNLVTNGPRCGIITLLHWDRRQPSPAGFVPEELRRAGVVVVRAGSEFSTLPALGPGVRFAFDPPPPPELATELLHRIGRASGDANKVAVPFDVVAPAIPAIWGEGTIDEIRVPIGRTGASKLQYLSLGRGTRQHALISGKTGSGKSNLLHVIVTNLALRCGPSEIEFYLVDFKKGVEFKAYATARLPHARVVAIESEREFGLSVLEKLDEELRRRGDLFRALGVQDVPGYRNGGGKEPMPRCLLLVDEFQEYFVQEDRVSQNAAVLLDRIVRQGRAFGIHVILASQTLGGTYALARATLGQMAVRIAFHCDEADAYLIMGEENPAPRLLSRPGEGIYNDAAGALEANSPFQAVWLPDDVRDRYLDEIRKRTAQLGGIAPVPVVFEGSAPAGIENNPDLLRCLARPPERAPTSPAAWLGAPNSIKGPTSAVFSRTGGSNLLVVGQREDASLSLVISALVSLAAQHPPSAARFVVVDAIPSGTARSELLRLAIAAMPQPVEQVQPGQLPAAMAELSAELAERTANGHEGKPSVFVVVVGLQQCKKLKPDDSFGFSSDPADPAAAAAATFQTLQVEGPTNGIHLVVAVDSYNNANRYLGRKGLTEFESRVLLQMSASDSSSLMDAPTASTLGLYGAVYYNDREGRVETFRPYALPEAHWLAEVGKRLGGA